MVSPLLIPLPGHEAVAEALAALLPGELALASWHAFPDGETLVTLPPVAGRDVVLVCSLHQPDPQVMPLLFAADAARELGARRIGLATPYLAYMRQDRRFHDGEAVTSRTFAALLSRYLDFLVTVDPHLHRYDSLDEIYTLQAVAVSASPAIARWLQARQPDALLVGPDEESAQWVSAIAALAGLPHAVLTKVRHDDFHVEVSLPDAGRWHGRQPVLVDDIISSARTLVAATDSLRRCGLAAPWCVGVHGLFSADAVAALEAAGVAGVVTCNTVRHASNGIDVLPELAEGLRRCLN